MLFFNCFFLQRCRTLAAALLLMLPALVLPQTPTHTSAADDASALLQRHAVLAPQLARNPYRRPLFLESEETTRAVSGHVYAVVHTPFATFSKSLRHPGRWCEVLILHLNTKFCQARDEPRPAQLTLNIGKKTPQTLDEAFPLQLDYRLVASTSTFMAIDMRADKGPVGTSQYRIELEAVALPGEKTFMHLRYAYGFGMAGKLAMQAYLATAGNSKMGFTQTHAGEPTAYVGGMRGAVERNTMRYYLAIEAYLASLSAAPAQQLETRLAYWFDATEQYPTQLREIGREAYLQMKRNEYRRQQTAPAGTRAVPPG